MAQLVRGRRSSRGAAAPSALRPCPPHARPPPPRSPPAQRRHAPGRGRAAAGALAPLPARHPAGPVHLPAQVCARAAALCMLAAQCRAEPCRAVLGWSCEPVARRPLGGSNQGPRLPVPTPAAALPTRNRLTLAKMGRKHAAKQRRVGHVPHAWRVLGRGGDFDQARPRWRVAVWGAPHRAHGCPVAVAAGRTA